MDSSLSARNGHSAGCSIHASVDSSDRSCGRPGANRPASPSAGCNHAACKTPSAQPAPGTTPVAGDTPAQPPPIRKTPQQRPAPILRIASLPIPARKTRRTRTRIKTAAIPALQEPSPSRVTLPLPMSIRKKSLKSAARKSTSSPAASKTSAPWAIATSAAAAWATGTPPTPRSRWARVTPWRSRRAPTSSPTR